MLERLNNLPLNTVTPSFVAIFVFFGIASSFIEKFSFLEIKAKREAILFLFGCSKVNSTWIITSGLANQRAPKVNVMHVTFFVTSVTFSVKIKQRTGTAKQNCLTEVTMIAFPRGKR